MEVGWAREQRVEQHWESCHHPRETGSRAGDGQGVWLGRGEGLEVEAADVELW